MRSEQRRRLTYEIQRLMNAHRSQREIARGLGIARKTVRKLLRELEDRRRNGESVLDREVKPRVPKTSKLDNYEESIREWLKKWSDLTAVRCLEKLELGGFKGGYTIVRERLKALRLELVPPQPKATPVETAPGQRAEFDWSPYVLEGGQKVQLWNATLRWSRAPSLAADTNTRQTTILRRLREAFEEWKGVPHEALTDSMPGVVDRWECDQPVLNARYVDFVAYYGYRALIAPRRCPQWKAVAERLFLFHEKNLLNGRTIRGVEDYAEVLAWWKREKSLGKDHPETKRPVHEMLALERPHLLPLPARPYDTRDVVVRVVDDYQRVHLETNHYPVPAPIGSRVYVCADASRLEVVDHQARRLIEHERLPDGARIKLNPPHVRKVRYDLDALVERLAGWGERAEAYARGLRAARRYAGPQLVRLLQLQIDWSVDDVVAAMDQAMTYRCFDVAAVQRILETRYSPRRFEDHIADSTRQRIQEVMKDHTVTPRPLSTYTALRDGDPPREKRSEPHAPSD
jgi:transposase